MRVNNLIKQCVSYCTAVPYWKWYCVIFFVAFFLRSEIAYYNLESNDNHYRVVNYVLKHGEVPTPDKCWQCYHPKAFHLTAAAAVALVSPDTPSGQFRVMNYVNVVAGMVTLLFLILFLSRLPFNPLIKLLGFAIAALNPKLTAINAQVTNDSFAIMFAAIALYYIYRYIQEGTLRFFLFSVIGIALTTMSKGSGLVLFIAFTTLIIAAPLPPLFKRFSKTKSLALFFCIFFLTVPWSGYYQNARYYGSPLAINTAKDPFPHLYKKSLESKAGVVSIVHSYATFRILDLLQNPLLTNDTEYYPDHHNSVWTQLYARHTFSRYERYPWSWVTYNPILLRNARLAYIFGLIPLALMFIGLGSIIKELWNRKDQGLSNMFTGSDWFYLLVTVGFLGLIINMTVSYRLLCTMKPIYIYPGAFAFLYLFLKGSERLLAKKPNYKIAIILPIIALSTLYAIDSYSLGFDLSKVHPEKAAQRNKSAQLSPNSLQRDSSNYTRLTDLKPSATHQDYGSLQISKSISKKPLTINGLLYANGIGTHAHSTITYNLGNNHSYTEFITGYGIDDNALSADGVQFRIFRDSLLAWESNLVYSHQYNSVTLDIANAQEITLEVLELKNRTKDHVNWIEPLLLHK